MFSITDHPDPHRGNPFPPGRLVENKPRLDIWSLQRAGALTQEATTAVTLQGEHVGCLRGLHGARIQLELGAAKFEILLIEDMPMAGVPRIWFQCPACQKRCRHIYLPEVRCRLCLGLRYAVNHCSRWGNLYRIVGLRRLLNVDERPFAEIPPPKRRRGRYWRLAVQIAQEEHKLLVGMRRFAEAAGKAARND